MLPYNFIHTHTHTHTLTHTHTHTHIHTYVYLKENRKSPPVQPSAELTETLKPYIRYLGFFHGSCVLITHGANLHSPLPLFVSLLEKFLHDAVCPLPIQFQGLGGVAQVCTVYHVAKDLKSPNFGNPIKLGINTTRTSHSSCTSTLGTRPKNILVAL